MGSGQIDDDLVGESLFHLLSFPFTVLLFFFRQTTVLSPPHNPTHLSHSTSLSFTLQYPRLLARHLQRPNPSAGVGVSTHSVRALRTSYYGCASASYVLHYLLLLLRVFCFTRCCLFTNALPYFPSSPFAHTFLPDSVPASFHLSRYHSDGQRRAARLASHNLKDDDKIVRPSSSSPQSSILG